LSNTKYLIHLQQMVGKGERGRGKSPPFPFEIQTDDSGRGTRRGKKQTQSKNCAIQHGALQTRAITHMCDHSRLRTQRSYHKQCGLGGLWGREEDVVED